MRRSLIALAAPVALVIAACGSTYSSSTQSAAPAAARTPVTATSGPSRGGPVALGTRSVAGVGTVLVDGRGRTLYAFGPDRAKRVTCVGGCAAVWPPLAAPAGGQPSISGQARAGLVSSDVNPAGGRVVTYHGWPLYSYVGDRGAGTANGQGLNANGGYWWAIMPAGQVVTGHAVVTGPAQSSSGSGTSSSGSTTSSTGGGTGYGY